MAKRKATKPMFRSIIPMIPTVASVNEGPVVENWKVVKKLKKGGR